MMYFCPFTVRGDDLGMEDSFMDMKQNNVQTAGITADQLQNEFDYMMAQQILKTMLEKGLISLAEFNKIKALNLEKFSPELTSIMPTNA